MCNWSIWTFPLEWISVLNIGLPFWLITLYLFFLNIPFEFDEYPFTFTYFFWFTFTFTLRMNIDIPLPFIDLVYLLDSSIWFTFWITKIYLLSHFPKNIRIVYQIDTFHCIGWYEYDLIFPRFALIFCDTTKLSYFFFFSRFRFAPFFHFKD